MKIVINTCAGREHYVQNLTPALPSAIINYDDFTDPGKYKSTAYRNYQRGLSLAKGENLLLMEDDIILADNFLPRVRNAVNAYPGKLIQFFSMRKMDLTIGTREEPGRTYSMSQCTFFPKHLVERIYLYSYLYDNPDHTTAPYDLMIAEYLMHNRLTYIIHVPNLVDHIVGKSAIHPRRPAKRQSLTFEKTNHDKH